VPVRAAGLWRIGRRNILIYFNMFKYIYHAFKCMVKTVTLTDEAYNSLAAKKGPKESFSDVVLKITKKGSIVDLAGILEEKEASALRKRILKRRKAMRSRAQKIAGFL
jgi:predicted CopG family antitoxin